MRPDTTDRRRLAALEGYSVLDTAPEQGFDDIVLIATQICDAPIGLISFVAADRQWFKARVGFAPSETDLRSSVCAFALEETELLVIEDLAADPRTADNPLVTAGPKIRFYAGAPLRTGAGETLGTLCVIDQAPRPGGLTGVQAETLTRLARQVVSQLELGRVTRRQQESQALYQTLFNSMDEGFCVIEFVDGPDGPLSDYVHLEANAAYERHAGIANVVGQRVREMAPAEAAGWVELYKRVLQTGLPIRFERTLEATGRHLELSAFRIEPPSLRQVAVLFQDVTARRKAEQALTSVNASLEARVESALAERQLLADIVDGTDAFVQLVDPDFRWLAINGAAANEFERLYGVRPKVGDVMLDLLEGRTEDRDTVAAIWARALAGEDFVTIGEFGDRDGGRRSYEMRMRLLRDPGGRLVGAYQFAYDVSERLSEQQQLREAEEALRHAHKMDAVGQLTGGLAHDFNNLLAGISGSLELMRTRIAQGRLADVERYMTAAQGATRRAASLTHRLLAFSRRQTLDPKPTDVNQLVGGMEDLVRRSVGPSIDIEVVGAAGLWPALVDPPQLENALLNLCINARDAMPDGGRIVIETANKWLDEHASRQHDIPAGQYLSLCVTDTGVGMPPDVIARAFEPFFTTKPIGVGTGLGLSMIYGFAKQSGGQVRIYSELGQGTTVCIYLPRHHHEAAAPDAPAAPANGQRSEHAETILVVDDEPTVRMLVTDVLEELGYSVMEAADSIEGLKAVQSGARIDLLVSDIGLPGGMNGRQLAEAARAVRPKLKVLFITGYAENALIGAGHLQPGMEVITKPFAVDAIVARIRQLLART